MVLVRLSILFTLSLCTTATWEASLPRPDQAAINSPEKQASLRPDAASSESIEHWLESVGAGEENGSRRMESSEGVVPRRQSAEETEEEALMLLALQQIEDGRPGGLGAEQQGAGSVQGLQGSSVSALANGGSIDEDELLMLQALGQLEMHQATLPQKQQQQQQQQQQQWQQSKKRRRKGKGRTGQAQI
eukprot:1143110-Pelagomonas_calceolata.AAC.5